MAMKDRKELELEIEEWVGMNNAHIDLGSGQQRGLYLIMRLLWEILEGLDELRRPPAPSKVRTW